MADVAIDSSISLRTGRAFRTLVFTTESIGYAFYFDGDITFGYSKTTDGGASWGAQVEIAAATTHLAFDVWFDQWTPGDSGTLIHTVYFDTTNDDVFYRTLDTNGDTLGTQRTVFNGGSAVADIGAFCSITKAEGGRLWIAYDIDNGAEKGTSRSDDGITWTAGTSNLMEAADDWALLIPAANTDDPDDAMALYFDASADALTMKLLDSSSEGSPYAVIESSTIAAVIENVTDLTGQYPFGCSIRHSDGRVILAVVTERDTGTADHRVFSLNATGSALSPTYSITELTAITTDIDDHYYPQVFINQLNDDIYVAYNGKRDGSEVLGTTTKVYYTKSTDDGTTWSAGDTTYMEGSAANVIQLWTPLMGPRFYVSWLRTIDDLEGNEVNSVTFAAAPASLPPPPNNPMIPHLMM